MTRPDRTYNGARPIFAFFGGRCAIALSTVIFLSPSLILASNVDPVERYLAAYESAETAAIPSLSREAFDQISLISVTSLKDPELGRLFRALDIISYYLPEPAPTLSYVRTADELSRRNLLSRMDVQRVADALSVARMKKETIAFTQKHGTRIDYLHAEGVEQHNRAVIKFHGDRATSESYAFPKGAFVLAVGLPACHFAENAATDIGSDPRLAKAMAEYGKWIVPQARGVSIKHILDWNKRHREFPLAIMWQARQWPELNGWASPTFYFFRNGKLVDQHVGWRQPEASVSFEQKLRAIGIK